MGSRKQPLWRNVYATYAFNFVAGFFFETTFGPLFDKYVYSLSGHHIGPTLLPFNGRNALVGFTESISGLSTLLLAIPVGLVLDRRPERRARFLRFAALTNIASCLVIGLAVYSDVVVVLYVSLVLAGLTAELAGSASEAIFADSLPEGERATPNLTKTIFAVAGVAVGPLLVALWEKFVSNDWTMSAVKTVLYMSLLSGVPLSLLMLAFVDPSAEEEPEPEAVPKVDSNAPLETLEANLAPADEPDVGPVLRAARSSFGPFRSKHVPFILTASDVLTFIGAGMSVKFFNLFFIQDEYFSPIQINLLLFSYMIVLSIIMKLLGPISGKIGRAQTSLLCSALGVGCLIVMSTVKQVVPLVAVFLIRGGLANSAAPLDRSIIMDFTPSSQRGRWNAVASMSSVCWSGSAFLGGFISDSHDYRGTFFITAVVYAFACVIYSPALWLVPKTQPAAQQST